MAAWVGEVQKLSLWQSDLKTTFGNVTPPKSLKSLLVSHTRDISAQL